MARKKKKRLVGWTTKESFACFLHFLIHKNGDQYQIPSINLFQKPKWDFINTKVRITIEEL